MTLSLSRALRRFARTERGSATIEFAITFPAMLLWLVSGVELGMVTLHQSMLEREKVGPLLHPQIGAVGKPFHASLGFESLQQIQHRPQ